MPTSTASKRAPKMAYMDEENCSGMEEELSISDSECEIEVSGQEMGSSESDFEALKVPAKQNGRRAAAASTTRSAAKKTTTATKKPATRRKTKEEPAATATATTTSAAAITPPSTSTRKRLGSATSAAGAAAAMGGSAGRRVGLSRNAPVRPLSPVRIPPN